MLVVQSCGLQMQAFDLFFKFQMIFTQVCFLNGFLGIWAKVCCICSGPNHHLKGGYNTIQEISKMFIASSIDATFFFFKVYGWCRYCFKNVIVSSRYMMQEYPLQLISAVQADQLIDKERGFGEG